MDRREFEEAVAEALRLLSGLDRVQAAVSWRIGDLALRVETHYGEASLERFAKAIEMNKHSLRDLRRVAAAFGNDERSSKLSWSHHQRLASRDDRIDWLVRAEAAGWSVRDLEYQVDRADLLAQAEFVAGARHRRDDNCNCEECRPEREEEDSGNYDDEEEQEVDEPLQRGGCRTGQS